MVSALPPDPYAALSVSADATLAEIRSSHRKLVLRLHPDKIQDPEKKTAAIDAFQKVQEAYELLSDEARREEYDSKVTLARLKKEVDAMPTRPARGQGFGSKPQYEFDVRPPTWQSTGSRHDKNPRPRSFDDNERDHVYTAEEVLSRKAQSHSYDEGMKSQRRAHEHARETLRREEDLKLRERTAAKEAKMAAFHKRTKQRDHDRKRGAEDKYNVRCPPSEEESEDDIQSWTRESARRKSSPPRQARPRSYSIDSLTESDSEDQLRSSYTTRTFKSAPATVINPAVEPTRPSTFAAIAVPEPDLGEVEKAADRANKLRHDADKAAAYMTAMKSRKPSATVAAETEFQPRPIRRAETFQEGTRPKSAYVTEDAQDANYARRPFERPPLRHAATMQTPSKSRDTYDSRPSTPFDKTSPYESPKVDSTKTSSCRRTPQSAAPSLLDKLKGFGRSDSKSSDDVDPPVSQKRGKTTPSLGRAATFSGDRYLPKTRLSNQPVYYESPCDESCGSSDESDASYISPLAQSRSRRHDPTTQADPTRYKVEKKLGVTPIITRQSFGTPTSTHEPRPRNPEETTSRRASEQTIDRSARPSKRTTSRQNSTSVSQSAIDSALLGTEKIRPSSKSTKRDSISSDKVSIDKGSVRGENSYPSTYDVTDHERGTDHVTIERTPRKYAWRFSERSAEPVTSYESHKSVPRARGKA